MTESLYTAVTQSQFMLFVRGALNDMLVAKGDWTSERLSVRVVCGKSKFEFESEMHCKSV